MGDVGEDTLNTPVVDHQPLSAADDALTQSFVSVGGYLSGIPFWVDCCLSLACFLGNVGNFVKYFQHIFYTIGRLMINFCLLVLWLPPVTRERIWKTRSINRRLLHPIVLVVGTAVSKVSLTRAGDGDTSDDDDDDDNGEANNDCNATQAYPDCLTFSRDLQTMVVLFGRLWDVWIW